MTESSFSNSGLLLYLQQLRREDFWKFKQHLKEEPQKLNLQPLSWAKIKNGSREDLAKLLHKHYSEQQAWNVTLNIFLAIDRRDLWGKAQEEIHHNINPYKNHMESKFRVIWEKETCLPVPDSFYKETIKTEYDNLKSAFPPEKTHKRALTVVLRGPEGVGKTTFLRKVMLEWARGNIWNDRFTHVFFLNVCEMRRLRKTSLVEWLSRDWPASSKLLEQIFSQPQAILFLVDSIEELKLNTLLDDDLCDDWNQPRPPEIILGSLLQKAMLPSSSLLIALKPADVGKNYLLPWQKPIVIPGFSEEQVELYFLLFFAEKTKAMKAFDFVRNRQPLLWLCQKPLFCWLTCSALTRQLARGEELEVEFGTITSFYVSFLTTVFRAGGEDSPQCQNVASLKALCSLAAEGTWTCTYFFLTEDLGTHGVSTADVSMWLSLNILRQNGDSITFSHDQVQEFFTAMFYLLKQPEDEPNPFIGSISQLISTCLKQERTGLSLVKQFVFGLLSEATAKTLESCYGPQKSQEVKQEMLKCIKSLSHFDDNDPELNFQELFDGVFENHEEEFVTAVMSFFEEVTIHVENTQELVINSYCLSHCRNLHKLTMCLGDVFSEDSELPRTEKLAIWQNCCSIFHTNENLQVFLLENCAYSHAPMAILCKAIAHPLCRLHSLTVMFMTNLGEGASFFKSVSQIPRLKYLNLHGTNLSHSAVREMCRMLKHPMCNIEKIILGDCSITHKDCEEIVSAFVENHKLTHVSLAENVLTDAGAMLLCDSLINPQVVLKTLILNECGLSYVFCDYIAQILLWNRSLTLLDLGSNNLSDRGANSLCEALKNPECHLQELWLVGCHLTPACCKNIASVFMTNQKLKGLRLGSNNILDAGAKELCEALKHPDCKLESIGLEMCGLTSAICEDIASVITTCKTLRILNLGMIAFSHQDVKVLCSALSHADCALQTLGLNKTDFDEESQLLLLHVGEQNLRLSISNYPWIEEEFQIRGLIGN